MTRAALREASLPRGAVKRKRLKYLHTYIDNRGRARHYVRQKGTPSITLTADYGSEEFLAQYWRALGIPRPASVKEAPRSTSQREGYIYFYRVGDSIKIGFSATPGGRLAGLQTGNSKRPDSVVIVRGTMADERNLHRTFEAKREAGEWFKASPDLLIAIRKFLRLGRIELS